MSTLNLYETLSGISADMVHAAETGDWDRLIELERTVARMRNRLSVEDAQSKLSEAERDRKVHLIQRILADDRKVRSYTEPWMEQVRRFLGDSSRGRDIRNTYTAAGY
jgi:flagellar protein FliT